MKTTTRMSVFGAAVLALASICSAGPITGSLALSGQNAVGVGGTDLSNFTSVIATPIVTSGVGVGDYAPIPLLTLYGTAVVNFSTFLPLQISNPLWGDFTATSGSVFGPRTANFVNVFYLGTYTPGPSMPASLTSSAASLRISINQSGGSLSEAITLNSPPNTVGIVPEPGTMLMFGSSLMAVGLLGRRFLNSK